MIFWYPKSNISADGLGGRGGRPHIAYNLRTNEVLLHDKFQGAGLKPTVVVPDTFSINIVNVISVF